MIKTHSTKYDESKEQVLIKLNNYRPEAAPVEGGIAPMPTPPEGIETNIE